MRLFLHLPHELATALITSAKKDHRSPRQEAEWLLCKAIEQATRKQERAQAPPEQTRALMGAGDENQQTTQPVPLLEMADAPAQQF